MSHFYVTITSVTVTVKIYDNYYDIVSLSKKFDSLFILKIWHPN